MDSAIDKHLQCPRSISKRVGDDYVPPFPMYVGKKGTSLQDVVMGYFGIQYKGEERRSQALEALKHIVSSFKVRSGPQHHDLAHVIDTDGYDNLFAVGYWASIEQHKNWESTPEIKEWWASDKRSSEGIGYFKEVMSPRAEQFETVYPFTDRLPALGVLLEGASKPVQEHGYWGSARDRFPVSQYDRMVPSGALAVQTGDPSRGGRVVIAGHGNLCLIRSGQDWSETEGEERRLYLEEIHPTLEAGMDFLRDQGKEIGCYSNRFMRLIDLDGQELEHTYGLSHWRSLERLERWAESHTTHLRIFVKFNSVAEKMVKSRLYHEVSVFDAANQHFEYISCHPRTGLMRDAQATT
jgi:aliphatic aldoxime dehydratase